MPPLSMLIKPASSLCNLRCRYCFYEDVSDHRQVKSYGMIGPQVTEAIIRKALEFADGTCTFSFQGGEPTLRGLDYFEEFCDLVDRCNHKKTAIRYAIQTNGMVLDEAWASFLRKRNFLVGLSMDGTREIHDSLRVDPEGKGTYGRVLRAAQLLEKHGVEFNILCVVTASIARHGEQVYRSLCKNGFRYLQFIPCLAPMGEQPDPRFGLTPKRYGQFLHAVFQAWYGDLCQGRYTSVQHIDHYLGVLRGEPPLLCSMTGHCACQFVMEADGSVYPCDFYVTDEWKVGNILDNGFEEMANHPNARRFVEISLDRGEKCRACQWFALCRGGCRRDREPVTGTGMAENVFCESYRSFFQQDFEALARAARMMR
ncbi:MAG: anaerobic sulfatase maturase [Eubacteriales bacterium]